MGAEISLQPVEKVEQVVLLEPMEIHVGQIHPSAHGGSHERGRGSALRKAAAHGEFPGAGSWQKLQPVERSLHRSWFCGRSCSSWGTHGGSVCCLSNVPCEYTGAVCEELYAVGQEKAMKREEWQK